MGGRKLKFYEKILLIICLLVIGIGYFYIYSFTIKHGISWQAIQTIFLWLLLIVGIFALIILEGVKEELKIVHLDNVNETKLLRQDLKRK